MFAETTLSCISNPIYTAHLASDSELEDLQYRAETNKTNETDGITIFDKIFVVSTQVHHKQNTFHICKVMHPFAAFASASVGVYNDYVTV
jgi:hypothetical protein